MHQRPRRSIAARPPGPEHTPARVISVRARTHPGRISCATLTRSVVKARVIMRLRTRFNIALGSVFALGFILSILVTMPWYCRTPRTSCCATPA